MSIESSPQTNRAAQRLEQFDAKNQEEAYWKELIGDAGETDFSDQARQRLEEAAAYDEHLRMMSETDSYGTLDAALDKSENGAYTDSIDRTIASDPRLRRMSSMANRINTLRQHPLTTNDDPDQLLRQLNQKEDDLQELLMTFNETSTLPEAGKQEIINRIINQTHGQTATETLDTPSTDAPDTSAKPKKLTDADTTDLQNLKAADVSINNVTAVESSATTPDDITVLQNMPPADISVDRTTSNDQKMSHDDEKLSDEERATLASLDYADTSVDRSRSDEQQAGDNGEKLSDEERATLASLDSADTSVDRQEDTRQLNAERAVDYDADKVAEQHRHNRFNPLYRARLAFNNFRSKRSEKNETADSNEKRKAGNKAIGAAAVAAAALAAVIVAKHNPDAVQNVQDWFNDLNLDFWNDNGQVQPDTTPDQPSTPDTTPDATPDSGDNGADGNTNENDGNTGDQAPVEPELLNAPAFNTPNGGGGELLMTNLGLDPREWYSISADLPDLFPNEFYREQLPGLVDVRFSHPGFLSEDAQKLLLERLGKS